ncbi:Atu4866 domain-containing protein [Flavobacterium sp.]|uniref:Atu4866 domain-containing protein n=1 Tax=Flavobacterium sp. TaxID=239 RepID=UPI00286D790D|nr:Atu4866 domain-containing protein [Flavobacterium sp.]
MEIYQFINSFYKLIEINLNLKLDFSGVAVFLLTIVFFSSKDAINNSQKMDNENKYVGMWVTKDGYIRHELLPNNRYDEARGNRKSAYQGDYKITVDHIDYKDDTGFVADGDFKNDILYHAGMILYREKVQ